MVSVTFESQDIGQLNQLDGVQIVQWIYGQCCYVTGFQYNAGGPVCVSIQAQCCTFTCYSTTGLGVFTTPNGEKITRIIFTLL